MSAPQIQNGEIGLVISRTLLDQNGDVVDVSGYGTKRIVLQAPSGALQDIDSGVTYPGGKGIVQYTVTNGVINEDGGWEMQFSLENGTTAVIKTPIEKFQVGERLV